MGLNVYHVHFVLNVIVHLIFYSYLCLEKSRYCCMSISKMLGIRISAAILQQSLGPTIFLHSQMSKNSKHDQVVVVFPYS